MPDQNVPQAVRRWMAGHRFLHMRMQFAHSRRLASASVSCVLVGSAAFAAVVSGPSATAGARPRLETRFFEIWATGEQVTGWKLQLTETVPPCTLVTTGKGTETLKYTSDTEEFKFLDFGFAAQFLEKTNSGRHVITVQERNGSLTAIYKGAGCPPGTSSPTSDCKKPVHGHSPHVDPEYLTAKISNRKEGGITFDIGHITSKFSDPRHQFICPMDFGATAAPVDLINETAVHGRALFLIFSKVTLRQLADLGHGKVMILRGKSDYHVRKCDPPQPGLTCNFDTTEAWELHIKRP